MQTEIVLTTINKIDSLLKEYITNLSTYNHEVGFQIIADSKTPNEENLKYIKSLSYPIKYLTLKDQENLFKSYFNRKFKKYLDIFPRGTDVMRAMGFLTAKADGAKTIISIDDDNFPLVDRDFVGEHCVSKSKTLPEISSPNKWINTCYFLRSNVNNIYYSRGFPLIKRESVTYSCRSVTKKSVLNAGLWSNVPDIDAISHLENPDVRSPADRIQSYFVAKDNFLCIPTQNTSFSTEILPCYYYIRMGDQISPFKINRYGDIFQGFFAKKVLDSNNLTVSFGEPLTDHRRNMHNIESDFKNEFWGMIITNWLSEHLEKIEIDSKGLYSGYLELSLELEHSFPFREHSLKKYWRKVCQNMRVWLEILDKFF